MNPYFCDCKACALDAPMCLGTTWKIYDVTKDTWEQYPKITGTFTATIPLNGPITIEVHK